MSIELVSTEFVPIDPVVVSASLSAVPAKSSIPKLPHTEQWSDRTRLIPSSLPISCGVEREQ